MGVLTRVGCCYIDLPYTCSCQKLPKSAIKESKVQESLLTTDQVARYLKVDKFTVYRLVAAKKLPAFRVGNQWRYKRSVIDVWLTKNSNVSRKRSRLA